MTKKLKQIFAFAAVATLVSLSGCATTEGFIDDATITTKVKAAIWNEPSLKVMDISVRTEGKVVELSGSVKSRADKAKAAELARDVVGVRKVKNDLAIQP
jgi:osmotically-inducible protein OsmY